MPGTGLGDGRVSLVTDRASSRNSRAGAPSLTADNTERRAVDAAMVDLRTLRFPASHRSFLGGRDNTRLSVGRGRVATPSPFWRLGADLASEPYSAGSGEPHPCPREPPVVVSVSRREGRSGISRLVQPSSGGFLNREDGRNGGHHLPRVEGHHTHAGGIAPLAGYLPDRHSHHHTRRRRYEDLVVEADHEG